MKSNNTTSFKKKVQAMKASEIVQAMIDGLKKEWVEVNMGSYGHTERGICYGCAATNTICQITKHKFTPAEMNDFYNLKGKKNYINSFLSNFESSVNALRTGNINYFNDCAQTIDIKPIPLSLLKKAKLELPYLNTNSYKIKISKYQELADLLRKKGL